MSNNLIIRSYENEKVEQKKIALHCDLENYVKTQAVHDGQKLQHLNESEFDILVPQIIKSKTQLAIESIKEILGAASLLFNAKAEEEIVEKRISELQNEININSHTKNDLISKKAALPLRNILKEKVTKWILPVAIVAALIDSTISYENFRIAYQGFLAALMAIGVGAVVFSSHAFGIWPRKAKKKQSYSLRTAIVLISAFIFFLMIGILRSQASSSAVSTDIPTNEASTVSSNTHVSPLPFIVISFLLFTVPFFLSLFFSKTAKEKEIDEKHSDIKKAIADLDIKQIQLKKELKALPFKIAEKKEEARIVYYYMERSIQECKAISRNALAEYKKVFVQVRGMVPDFFSAYQELIYDDSFVNDLKNHK